jgi:hypothetical protein
MAEVVIPLALFLKLVGTAISMHGDQESSDR